jgi:hypothetical protein
MENLARHITIAISNGFVKDYLHLLPTFLDKAGQCSQVREVWKLKIGEVYLWQCLFELPLWFDGVRHYAGFSTGDIYDAWREYVLPSPV